MDNKQQQQYGAAPYPPSQGFSPTGFPQTGFAGPGSASGYPGQSSGYPGQSSGYMAGAPAPAGFVYPPAGAPHSAYHMPDQDTGPKPYSSQSGSSSYGDIHGIDFSEKSIRMAFIRKVYALLSVQLLATTGIIALFTLNDSVKGFVRQNSGLMIGSYVIAIILLFAMACCENLRRKSPHNFILLSLFTLTYGVVIGFIASQYNISSILLAAGVTTVVCVGLTIFAFQTKYDFTMMGGALFVCSLVFFLFSLLAIFLGPTMQLILAGVGAMLFSVFLVYDTQIMIGGKHKFALSPEEYIFAALNIYMDVIMIFLYLLQLFGDRN